MTNSPTNFTPREPERQTPVRSSQSHQEKLKDLNAKKDHLHS